MTCPRVRRRMRVRRSWILLLAVAGVSITAVAVLAPTAGGARNPGELVTSSATNGNGAFSSLYAGSSEDGTRVFFRSQEVLAPTDTDNLDDVYERSGSSTTQVSIGPVGGNGPFQPTYRGASADGARVFFETGEPLVASDTDALCDDQDGLSGPCVDVYEHSGGNTTLVSTGPTAGNGSFTASYRGCSADGSRVFFTTKEQLVASDTDTAIDVYERSGTTTTLVSTGPTGGNGDFDVVYKRISEDGTHVIVETGERLVSGDTDGATDVYERSAGSTTLVSSGPAGGNGAFDASYRGATPDAGHVYFETAEGLTSGDSDSAADVYDRAGGSTALVSTGPAGGNGAADALFEAAAADGSHVVFKSTERLVGGDTDSASDVYDRSGGATTLVSAGPAGGNAPVDALFQAASRDGLHVFVGTTESLVATDTDGRFDIYDRSGATTALVSTGPAGGQGAFDAFFRDASRDGSRVVFETVEALVSDDTDGLSDLYERTGGVTTRISTGGSGGNGASQSVFLDADPDASRVFFGTGEALAGNDGDTQSDVYVTTLPSGFARPKGATPIWIPFVIAYKQCTSPNRSHSGPLAGPACNPPVQVSDQLTVGTLDANSNPARSAGSLRFDVVPGNSGTPADEADVRLALNMNDIRKKSDLSDYSGELLATVSLRITDKRNGAVPVDSATVTDLPFSFGVPCATTTDTGIGSSCETTTAADAVLPGAVPEGARSIWQLGPIQLYDGGPDGDADTTPNTLFADEGYFVP
jgi:hypothetical protein